MRLGVRFTLSWVSRADVGIFPLPRRGLPSTPLLPGAGVQAIPCAGAACPLSAGAFYVPRMGLSAAGVGWVTLLLL